MSTKIEWTDETWNPVTGCTKVSQGCKNCYAERLAPKVFAGQMMQDHYLEMPNGGMPPRKREFRDVVCHPERLDVPLRWRNPRRVFVNSMSDLFHEDVHRNFIDAVWSTMAEAKQHTFQILTKRPERMREFMIDRRNKGWKADWRNIWLGVSVEDQATADERIPLLMQTPAAVRFVSYEPALGPINFRCLSIGSSAVSGNYQIKQMNFYINPLKGSMHLGWPGLDWIIAGGESGPGARPAHPDWFRSVRDQCAAAGVPFFFKQWGNWLGQEQDGNPKHVPFIVNAQNRPLHTTKKAAGRLLDGREHSEWPA